ncbi:MAG: hypothetical protein DU481_01910 [Nitrosomonas sp.]|uniref:Uncharacterized protein n=1 Tax=Nitrosomonas oligotropha TaxID=42354 RepID=A0A5C7VTG7_9PROT|nr:MAG: hypothetical protein E6Q60_07580 [Nitrosomonas oligotropha]
MKEDEFHLAWPDEIKVNVTITWTKPAPHDLLFSGGLDEDDTAYFYSIVGRVDREWWPFYIGMTHAQSAAKRNQQVDHQERLKLLKKKNKGQDFSITLGTPTFPKGTRVTSSLIGKIEGLLIYSNWNDLMVNKKKTQGFSSNQSIYISNTGWAEHLEKEVAYGVFYREA